MQYTQPEYIRHSTTVYRAKPPVWHMTRSLLLAQFGAYSELDHQLSILLANSKMRATQSVSSDDSKHENRIRQQYHSGVLPSQQIKWFSGHETVHASRRVPEVGVSSCEGCDRSSRLACKCVSRSAIKASATCSSRAGVTSTVMITDGVTYGYVTYMCFSISCR
jgi:hypothetical protein